MRLANQALASSLAAAALSLAGTAHAAYTVTFTQGGGNVSAVGSGSLLTAGLTRDATFDSGGALPPFVEPAQSTIVMGAAGFQSYDVNFVVEGGAYGTGGYSAGSGTGSGAYLNDDGTSGFGIIGVPLGYTSGSSISNTALYTGASFASLGLKLGTYSYTYKVGSGSDTFSINVSSAATPTPPSSVSSAPEPGSWALLLGGVGVMGAMMRVAQARRREDELKSIATA